MVFSLSGMLEELAVLTRNLICYVRNDSEILEEV